MKNQRRMIMNGKDLEDSSHGLCEDIILPYFGQAEAKKITQPGTGPELKPWVLQEPAKYKQYSVLTFTIFTHL